MSDETNELTAEFSALAREKDELTAQVSQAEARLSQVRERMQRIAHHLSTGRPYADEGHGLTIAQKVICIVLQYPGRIFGAHDLVEMGTGPMRETLVACAFHTKQGRMERVARGRYRLAKAET